MRAAPKHSGNNGVAAVQAAADILTLFLALPLIRRVMRRIQEAEDRRTAAEAQKLLAEKAQCDIKTPTV